MFELIYKNMQDSLGETIKYTLQEPEDGVSTIDVFRLCIRYARAIGYSVNKEVLEEALEIEDFGE